MKTGRYMQDIVDKELGITRKYVILNAVNMMKYNEKNNLLQLSNKNVLTPLLFMHKSKDRAVKIKFNATKSNPFINILSKLMSNGVNRHKIRKQILDLLNRQEYKKLHKFAADAFNYYYPDIRIGVIKPKMRFKQQF